MSWKIGEDLVNLLAAQQRSIDSCIQYGETGRRIGGDPGMATPLLSWCQDDASGLNIRVERVAGAQAEPAPNRRW
jgi:hypothetical protein